MTIRHVGAKLQKTFYVDRDDIRHLARISGSPRSEHVNWQAATDAGFERLVAPSMLVVSYVESVLAALFEITVAGRLTDMTLGFNDPVYAGERVVVSAEVIALLEEPPRTGVNFQVLKEGGNDAIASGTTWLNLNTANQ